LLIPADLGPDRGAAASNPGEMAPSSLRRIGHVGGDFQALV